MGRQIIFIIFVLLYQLTWSQSIKVNPFGQPESNMGLETLVDSVFIRSGLCAPPVTNFQYSDNPARSFPSQDRSWGYYVNSPGTPLFEGVIITNGKAKNAEGPTKTYPANSFGDPSWPGDQIANMVAETNTLNATVFEFDFVPTGVSLFFNYRFATSEYPQTMKRDVLAVILSGPGITNDPGLNGINLAKIGNLPFTANNLINSSYFTPGPFSNIGYSGDSKDFYVNYYDLIPYQTYHIKFVIADADNHEIDSGAFLKAQSFIYDYELVGDHHGILGKYLTICDEEEYELIINTDEDDPNITYKWFYKEEEEDEYVPIPGQTGRSYTVHRGELVDGFYSGDGYYAVEVKNVQFCNEDRLLYTQLIFGDTPEIHDEIPIQSACSDDGTYYFNLPQTAAQFSDNPDVIFTFEEKIDGVWTAIEDPSFYQVIGTKIIRVRAAFFNDVCSKYFAVEFHVGKPLVSTPFPEVIKCNPGGETEIFNLLDYADDFTPPEIDYTGTLVEYYTDPTHENLITNPEEFQNTSNPQVLYVKIFYPEIPNCYAESEITLNVEQMPNTQNASIDVCDIQNDSTEYVDLTQNDIITTPGIEHTAIYYDSEGEEIPNPENYLITQDVTQFKVFVQNMLEDCAALRDLTVYMKQVPVLSEISLAKCGFGGKAKFHLPDINEVITESPEGMEFSYYLTETDAEEGINPLPDNYITPQAVSYIYARVENENGCIETTQIELIAEDNNAALEDILQECGSPWKPFDGHSRFNLTQYNNQINFELSLSETTISFYTSLEYANAGINAIHDPENYKNITNPQTIYARAQNLYDDCGGVAQFEIEALPVPDMEMDKDLIICVENDEVYSIDGEYESYTWYDSHGEIISTQNAVIFDHGDFYTLEVTKEGMTCPAKRNIEVIMGTPVITGIDVNGNDASFYVTGGVPPYKYSYDNGLTWTNWNGVKNLPSGIYDLIVMGGTGCISNPEPFAILNIPNVITPNGDGINDIWTVRGLGIYSDVHVKIFDRYGKIFVDKKLTDEDIWNGEYMGRNVTTGDYWYIITIDEDKRLTGHISVKSQ